ncbi:DNA-binding response OmpR family regulator [Methanomicrobium sp. W14]|uniref:response regulator n=1 Tax=Methanomicrobium sp. W14 TaxID=2817839 RepID=UPI001AEB094B|nr:response regulator [Methanomicrobium sp. W14]MBP2133727.1 DNA-binding response OmpR family regulator [Methanomicrobium sp. W14]
MKKILLIDDDYSILSLYSKFTEITGHIPVTATDLSECMDVLERNTPDLILLDILMQPEDGWEILGNIRKKNFSKDLPVIILTAKTPLQSEVQRYGAMIDGYLMKPVTHRVFRQKIDRFFDSAHKIRAFSEVLDKKDVSKCIINEYRSVCRQYRFLCDIIEIYERENLSLEITTFDKRNICNNNPEDSKEIGNIKASILKSRLRIKEIECLA